MAEIKRARVGSDSARRVLDLLFAFTEERPEASVKELADELAVPLPSAHRYVALLREKGLVSEGARGRYHLTPRVTALGRAARAANSMIDVATPFMRELAERIGETVLLARLVHDLPVCVHRVEASRRLRLSFEPGQNLPPLRGASVKVLVGSMPGTERDAYLNRVLTGEDTEARRAEFLAEAESAGADKWATSSQEIDEGVWAAAALVTQDGRAAAALAAACAGFRVDDERRVFVLDSVRETARRISDALGG
jgi:DNA-binding IclR family transcriptional regulator